MTLAQRDWLNLALGFICGQATVVLAFKLGVIAAKLLGGH